MWWCASEILLTHIFLPRWLDGFEFGNGHAAKILKRLARSEYFDDFFVGMENNGFASFIVSCVLSPMQKIMNINGCLVVGIHTCTVCVLFIQCIEIHANKP